METISFYMEILQSIFQATLQARDIQIQLMLII